ncbi:hypothetical protein ACJIZ3_020307 [Penstemon smallii]|uniref:Uncharacterized protein n=1 Tax=Penstemon smallii TaxID=265156 RepID=A0ABD3SJ26_9LAMI
MARLTYELEWSRKLPCLCQHSPAPTDRRTDTRWGRFGSMDSSSPLSSSIWSHQSGGVRSPPFWSRPERRRHITRRSSGHDQNEGGTHCRLSCSGQNAQPFPPSRQTTQNHQEVVVEQNREDPPPLLIKLPYELF